MGNKTPLFDRHQALGARIVDFGGWDMPVNYGSQIDEHHRVRKDAGVFDVSHMTVVDLAGDGCRDFLRHLVANDVDKLREAGRALYTCMLNERGGVVDDLIVYFRGPSDYRLVVNAATRDKDLAWIGRQASGFDLTIDERPELAMLAVQGPNAREKAVSVLDDDTALALKPFSAATCGEYFVARTGYTGEDGFEIIVADDKATALFDALLAVDVAPCGLGARDTLRLEAGLHLYGQDMDEDVTPLECGLSWTVAMKDERSFVGRQALEALRDRGIERQLAGLLLEGRGVLRHGQKVLCEGGEGVITSGGFSPTLERSIALAHVPAGTSGRVKVEIRGRELPARVVKPPFVRYGEVKIPGELLALEND